MHGTSINEVPGDWGELFVIEGSLYRTPRFNEFSTKKKKQPKRLLYRGIVINLPNPAILGSEQLLITPQYRAVYGYGTRNSKTGKQTA